MARILRIAQSAGRYTVLDENDTVLTSQTGKAAAVQAAIAHLHGGEGGEVIVLSEAGSITSRVPVGGSKAAAPPRPASTPPSTSQGPDPQHSRPTGAASGQPVAKRGPSAARSARPSTRPDFGPRPGSAEGTKGLADVVGEAAKAIDLSLGLKDTKGVLPKNVSDVSIKKILPKAAAANPTVILFNTHVSVAAAWIAFVGLVLGTGTLSAVFQAARRATTGGTTVGDYASTGVVFFAASALCLSVAAAAWAVLTGKMKSYGAIAAWVIGTAIVSGALSSAGLAAPSQEFIVRAVDNGSGTPPGWIASVIGAFLTYYGPVTCLSGLGVGAILGHLAYKIQEADNAGGSTA